MDKTQKKIYLTFDDGPISQITPWVLDVLKQHNIKATFFCVGENIVKYPNVYQRILAEHHAVGNHTYNHLNGWNTHTNTYIDNVILCDKAMKLSVSQQKVLFRPPYGKAKKSQIAQLLTKSVSNQIDYSVIMWDVLSGDYDSKTSPEKCLTNAINNVRNGSIIVFHDSLKSQKNIEYALPRFIEQAKAKGFKFEKLE